MSRILHEFGEALQVGMDSEVQWYLTRARESDRQKHLERTRAPRTEVAEPGGDK